MSYGIVREIFTTTSDSKTIRNFYLDDIFNLISFDRAIYQLLLEIHERIYSLFQNHRINTIK